MKAKEVKVGGTYIATVSGKKVSVSIEGRNAHGGWNAISLTTNRRIRIKTAGRLSHAENATAPAPDWLPTLEEIAEGEARTAARAADESEPPTDESVATPDAAPDTTAPKARKKNPRADGTMSGLDAAAKILADAGEPLDCKTITERAIAQGLWNPAGLTPAATIYSALLRHITAKGAQSRFRKTDRGRFAIA